MKKRNKILYAVVCLIIIIGIIIWKQNGFYKELQFSNRYKIVLMNDTGINFDIVEECANDVLQNVRHFVQKNGNFGNAVSIVSEELSEEQKNAIIEKFNEKEENIKISAEDVEILSIPATEIEDILKHYIVSGTIIIIMMLAYFVIRFNKLKWYIVALKSIMVPLLTELVMFSIVLITRIPFGRFTIGLAIGLYIVSVLLLNIKLENSKNEK